MHILLHHAEAAAHHVAFTVARSDPQVRLFKLGDAGPFLGRRFGDSVAAQALLGLGGARMRGLNWASEGVHKAVSPGHKGAHHAEKKGCGVEVARDRRVEST